MGRERGERDPPVPPLELTALEMTLKVSKGRKTLAQQQQHRM